MKCWKYHGVFPRQQASLPSMLGNLSGAVLRCWRWKSHAPLRRILSYAPGKDLLITTTLSQGYCRDSGAFPKADPHCAPSHSHWEPVWMPWQAAAISAPHRLPLAVPLAAPGSTPSPALRTGKPGLGYGSGPPIYQLLMFQHKWFTVFPFPRSCHWLNDLQAQGISSPNGFILQDRSKMMKPRTAKYIVRFQRERV